jgi:hypothetical protein
MAVRRVAAAKMPGANSATAHSVGIAPLHSRRRMRSGWRHILRIWLAKAAKPPRSGHALLKGYEAAIGAAASSSLAVNRAPRIVLGLGTCSSADDTDANSQHEQQEPHCRLLEWPLSYKCPHSRFIPSSPEIKQDGSRRSWCGGRETRNHYFPSLRCRTLISDAGFVQ